MDCNELIGCITTIKDDSIKIDDSMFPIFPLPVVGDEYYNAELESLVCANKTK